MVDDDVRQASKAPTLQPAHKIADRLEQTANVIRVKKLMLYVRNQRWETDLDLLSIISLQSLVQDLRQSYPMLSQLRARLEALVETLNKKNEYVQIVQTIVEEMAGLYPAAIFAEEVTRANLSGHGTDDLAFAEQQSNRLNVLISEISQKLEQDSQRDRVKKLMLSAACNAWETDPFKLNHTNLRNLIRELLQTYPTLDELGARFAAVVKSLNKPIEYALVAETALQELGKLYAEEPSLTKSATFIAPLCSSNVEVTSLELKPSYQINGIKKAQQAIAAQIPEGVIDLFDVRLEIVKYANPLRAKILLFSVTYHPFAGSPQDWISLKLHSLDGLLRSLTTVCRSLEELRSQLHTTVQQLNQPDEYVDVANAILKCLKPIYPALQQQVQQALQVGSVAGVTRASATQIGASHQATQVDAH